MFPAERTMVLSWESHKMIVVQLINSLSVINVNINSQHSNLASNHWIYWIYILFCISILFIILLFLFVFSFFSPPLLLWWLFLPQLTATIYIANNTIISTTTNILVVQTTFIHLNLSSKLPFRQIFIKFHNFLIKT